MARGSQGGGNQRTYLLLPPLLVRLLYAYEYVHAEGQRLYSLQVHTTSTNYLLDVGD